MTKELDENFLTIPVPQHVARARGVLSHSKASQPVRFRINPLDRETIKRAAAFCGVKEVPFYRWCALYVARELLRRKTGEVVSIDP